LSESTNLTIIDDQAFGECNNLTSFLFSDSVKKIGNDILYGPINLNNINLPSSLEYFGNNNSCNIPNFITIACD
jgi:hypothetical protein